MTEVATRITEIRRDGSELLLSWSDQQIQRLDVKWLRLSCACAVCREMKVPLNEAQPYFKRATQLLKLNPVGNYALHAEWADGHRTIMAIDRILDHRIKAA